jgi:hypothetical protein
MADPPDIPVANLAVLHKRLVSSSRVIEKCKSLQLEKTEMYVLLCPQSHMLREQRVKDSERELAELRARLAATDTDRAMLHNQLKVHVEQVASLKKDLERAHAGQRQALEEATTRFLCEKRKADQLEGRLREKLAPDPKSRDAERALELEKMVEVRAKTMVDQHAKELDKVKRDSAQQINKLEKKLEQLQEAMRVQAQRNSASDGAAAVPAKRPRAAGARAPDGPADSQSVGSSRGELIPEASELGHLLLGDGRTLRDLLGAGAPFEGSGSRDIAGQRDSERGAWDPTPEPPSPGGMLSPPPRSVTPTGPPLLASSPAPTADSSLGPAAAIYTPSPTAALAPPAKVPENAAAEPPARTFRPPTKRARLASATSAPSSPAPVSRSASDPGPLHPQPQPQPMAPTNTLISSTHAPVSLLSPIASASSPTAPTAKQCASPVLPFPKTPASGQLKPVPPPPASAPSQSKPVKAMPETTPPPSPPSPSSVSRLSSPPVDGKRLVPTAPASASVSSSPAIPTPARRVRNVAAPVLIPVLPELQEFPQHLGLLSTGGNMNTYPFHYYPFYYILL